MYAKHVLKVTVNNHVVSQKKRIYKDKNNNKEDNDCKNNKICFNIVSVKASKGKLQSNMWQYIKIKFAFLPMKPLTSQHSDPLLLLP